MQKFPIDIVREAFPALAAQSDAGATIFGLDDPAGTQVPRRVADAVAGAMLTASSNLGAKRGSGTITSPSRAPPKASGKMPMKPWRTCWARPRRERSSSVRP